MGKVETKEEQDRYAEAVLATVKAGKIGRVELDDLSDQVRQYMKTNGMEVDELHPEIEK